MTTCNHAEFGLKYHRRIENECDVEVAIYRCRRISQVIGFTESACFLIATALAELARNMLYHAQGGEISIYHIQQGNGSTGIELIATDHGPGIADITLAFQDHYSTRGTLGVGLPAVKRMMSSIDMDTLVGKGTIVRARRWL